MARLTSTRHLWLPQIENRMVIYCLWDSFPSDWRHNIDHNNRWQTISRICIPLVFFKPLRQLDSTSPCVIWNSLVLIWIVSTVNHGLAGSQTQVHIDSFLFLFSIVSQVVVDIMVCFLVPCVLSTVRPSVQSWCASFDDVDNALHLLQNLLNRGKAAVCDLLQRCDSISDCIQLFCLSWLVGWLLNIDHIY